MTIINIAAITATAFPGATIQVVDSQVDRDARGVANLGLVRRLDVRQYLRDHLRQSAPREGD